MSIEFKCPKCKAEIEADESLGGGAAECPGCGNMIFVPMQGIVQGRTIAGFVVERCLGVGGMGEVWLAHQKTMDRKVALKILAPALAENPEYIHRFMQEAKMAGRLQHPHIVTAFDAGNDNGVHYLAVEYVDGVELGDRLSKENLIPEAQALKYIRGIAEALKYAWDKHKMLHRDIKPANIMVNTDDEALLMDMGISKSMSEDCGLTMTGVVVGTPYYMSPEQATADKSLDFRSDLYSLGATLYHMVTGSVPYDGTTAMNILAKHMTEPFPPPREKNPALSEQCSDLLEIMMAKKKEGRHSSWAALIKDIDLVLGGNFPATPIPANTFEMTALKTPAARKRNGGAQPKKASALKKALLPLALLAMVAVGANVYLNMLQKAREKERVEAEALAAKEKAAEEEKQRKIEEERRKAATAAREEEKPSRQPVEAVSLPVQPAPQQSEADDAKTREMWEMAEKYARENPKDYDQNIANFNSIARAAEGTKYKIMADIEANKFLKAKKEALEEILNTLRRKADEMARSGAHKEAAKFLADYRGDFEKESFDERQRLADAIMEQVSDSKTRRRETQPGGMDTGMDGVPEGKLAGVYRKVFIELLLSHTATAITELDNAIKSNFAPHARDRLSDLRDLISETEKVEKVILENLEKDVGKATTLGGQEGKILRIKDQVIVFEPKQGKSMKTSPIKKITVSSLTTEEKAARITTPGIRPEAKALYLGLEELRKRNIQGARARFMEVGPLAVPLIRGMHKAQDEQFYSAQGGQEPRSPQEFRPAQDAQPKEEQQPEEDFKESPEAKDFMMRVNVKRDGKPPKREGDLYRELIKVSANFLNKTKADLRDMDFKILLIGSPVQDKRFYCVVKIFQTTGMNIEEGKANKTDESQHMFMYSDRDREFGIRFAGYVAAIYDKENKLYKVATSLPRVEKEADKIAGYEELTFFDQKGAKTSVPDYIRGQIIGPGPGPGQGPMDDDRRGGDKRDRR